MNSLQQNAIATADAAMRLADLPTYSELTAKKADMGCGHLWHAHLPLPDGQATAKCVKCGYEPTQQAAVTEEQIAAIHDGMFPTPYDGHANVIKFARAILALRPQQVEVEPSPITVIDAAQQEIARLRAENAQLNERIDAMVEPVEWQARANGSTHDDSWRKVSIAGCSEASVSERVEYLRTLKRNDGQPAYEFRALYTTAPTHESPRPAAVPMTEEQARKLWCASEVYGYHPGAVLDLIRAVESHHGITAQAGEGDV